MEKLKDKYKRFFTRTTQHIHRVQNNMLYLALNCTDEFELSVEDVRCLMHNVMNHDRSKYSITQFEAYVELTEYHYQKAKGLEYIYEDGVENRIENAVSKHYLVENHHPQRLDNTQEKMNKYELIEVICDLQSMAEEFNSNSCRSYFLENWVPKHKSRFGDDFDKNQSLMIQVIECFEKRNSE